MNFMTRSMKRRFLIIVSIVVALFVSFGFGTTVNAKQVSNQVSGQDSVQVSKQAPKQETKTETVYVTSSGKKYHKSTCRYVKDKSATSYSIDEAKKKGYTACSVCYK